MAEAILKNKNLDGVEVRSAGVHAANGSEASAHAQRVLEEKGIEHHHHSSMLTRDEVNWADLILTMTVSHKTVILQQYPECSKKLFTLKEFSGETYNHDVVDPFGGNIAIYQETYQELEKWINKAVEKL
jgi:protein arginine phosphatase